MGSRFVVNRLTMGGLGRSRVPVVVNVLRCMVVMSGGRVMVRVGGFGRRVIRFRGVGVVIVTVVGRLGRRVLMVAMGVSAVIVRRCVGGVVMAGIMRFGRVVRRMRIVRVVGLVFVAHVTPVPQPLCTVFDRETGIT